jgi:hypothetical protein
MVFKAIIVSCIFWFCIYRCTNHITVSKREERFNRWNLLISPKNKTLYNCLKLSKNYSNSGFWNIMINPPPCNSSKKWSYIPVDEFNCQIVFSLKDGKLSNEDIKKLKDEILKEFPIINLLFCKKELELL